MGTHRHEWSLTDFPVSQQALRYWRNPDPSRPIARKYPLRLPWKSRMFGPWIQIDHMGRIRY